MIGDNPGQSRCVKAVSGAEGTQKDLISVDDLGRLAITGMLADDLMKPDIRLDDTLLIDHRHSSFEFIFCVAKLIHHTGCHALSGTTSQQALK